jgi:L-lactate dehydrogenase complex protein LldG
MTGIIKEKKMSSRADILAKIKANKPESLVLPIVDSKIFDEQFDLQTNFKKMVEAVGGNVLEVNSIETIHAQVDILFPDSKIKYSNLENSESFNSISLAAIQKPQELEDLEILILEGEFGVAENGAVWLTNAELPIRVLPFITNHLVLVLDRSKLVQNMHEAYQHLEGENFDFGLFLSGPSKTADIEQSLVIGAQGAMSLTVLLYSR